MKVRYTSYGVGGDPVNRDFGLTDIEWGQNHRSPSPLHDIGIIPRKLVTNKQLITLL